MFATAALVPGGFIALGVGAFVFAWHWLTHRQGWQR